MLSYLRWRSRTTWPLRRLYHRLRPDWYKERVGREWERAGLQQFTFLTEEGLRPSHALLDVGCGSLRAGLHFIRYLEPGRYHGVDIDGELLEAGRRRLRRHGLRGKAPVLRQMDDFDFPSLGQRFDYALANSVFTHLPLNGILRCLLNIEPVLAEEGRFFATFFENPSERNLAPVSHDYQGTAFRTYLDRDPYHYDFGLLEILARKARLRVTYLGAWVKGGSQAMMVFTRA